MPGAPAVSSAANLHDGRDGGRGKSVSCPEVTSRPRQQPNLLQRGNDSVCTMRQTLEKQQKAAMAMVRNGGKQVKHDVKKAYFSVQQGIVDTPGLLVSSFLSFARYYLRPLFVLLSRLNFFLPAFRHTTLLTR